MLRLRAHREAGAVGPRSPGRGVKTAVALVRVLLVREPPVAVAAAVAVSGDAAAAVLRFREGFLVRFDGPSEDCGDAETAEDHADDDADGGHGVRVLRLAAVDVPGKDGEGVGGAGAGVDGCSVGAVEAGAGTAVAHDPGRHGHVEAGRRGHVGSV